MNKKDKYLWDRFKSSDFLNEKSFCLNTHDLASYIEGNKSKDEIQAIETHLAQCPACLNKLIELQILLRNEVKIPPKEIVENAKSLIGKPEITEPPIIIKLPVWLNISYSYLKNYVGYAAAIAALIFLSFSSVKFGKDTFNNRNKILSACISEMTFELENNTD